MADAVEPPDEAGVVEAVQAARAARAPLEIRGGGTRRGLGRPAQAARTLSTRSLTGIADYRPGELSLTAAAGATMAEVEAALAGGGQILPFEPPDPRAVFGGSAAEPTLGGTIATAMSGPRRVAVGGCADFVTGMRFVNGAGEAIRTGGRVMKNVTGYNLARLLCGSHGTLGVITEVSLRTAPRPEAEATVVVSGLPAVRAVEAMSAALGSADAPSGAAWTPSWDGGPSRACLRLEGFAGSVAARRAALARRLAGFGPVACLEGAESEALWRRMRDLEGFAPEPDALWRLAARPSQAPAVLEALPDGLAAGARLDLGGAAIWLAAPDRDEIARELRRVAAGAGAAAVLMRASPATRLAVGSFPPRAGPLAPVLRELRRRFDPDGVLNPGRMEA